MSIKRDQRTHLVTTNEYYIVSFFPTLSSCVLDYLLLYIRYNNNNKNNNIQYVAVVLYNEASKEYINKPFQRMIITYTRIEINNINRVCFYYLILYIVEENNNII